MTDENADTAIHGVGLSKVFKDFWGREKVAALTDVDVRVPNGCVFGLLGPNGAGKSTLIKLVLGHLYPSRGRLSVLGRPPRDVEAKQRIGYLPERSQLYKNLTAAETLNFFGRILGLSREQIDNRRQQLLAMVGLAGAEDRMIGEFSHGMGRRMGLAQALLNDPDLLILDEPTAGLDPVGCREVKDLVLTLGRRGKTILLTSHLLADVEEVCDEILLLFGGRVQSRGVIGDLLRQSDRTVLDFPNVSDATLAEVRQTLRREVPDEEIFASAPLNSLESYFLRVVAESNARCQATDGVRMGAGVAAYLQEQTAVAPATAPPPGECDRQRLRELAATPTPDASAPVAQEQPLSEAPAALDALMDAGTATEAPADAPEPEPRLDRDTLDKLTK